MSATKSRVPESEFVVTLPQVMGLSLASRTGARTTLGVLTELIASARERVVLGAPFMQGEEKLLAGPVGIAIRGALERGVDFDLISTGASLASLVPRAFSQKSNGRVRLYRPKENIQDERFIGSHAKFCISDSAHCYVGSANFTQRGISNQLEIGVLLHGRVARQIHTFIDKLLEAGFFKVVR